MKIVRFIVAFMFASALASTTASRAEVLQHYWAPAGPWTYDGCDEYIQVQGQLHAIYTSTLAEDGSYHLVYHVNVQGTGTGASGAEYVYHESYTEIKNLNVGENYSWQGLLKLVGKGATPNLNWHAMFHMTVNANGELTATVQSAGTDCH